MDPRTHRRFLEYRETFGYFRAEMKTILDRESWLAFDEELRSLEERPARTWTADEAARAKALKRLLLRD
jgi:hypothetical protein